MSDLTLEEKTNSAVNRAREIEAEKHFYELNQPHFPLGFTVFQRNLGHWDVTALRCPGRASAWKAAHPEGFTSEKDREYERAFRIRGEPGNVLVSDERWDPTRPQRDWIKFRSVMAAMVWICEELMQEPKPKAANDGSM